MEFERYNFSGTYRGTKNMHQKYSTEKNYQQKNKKCGGGGTPAPPHEI